jgi:7,8-dihydropterin-6-yl-methyl-4-(beta-D-ribofuranosyl)aminobenzene 5'-phosphate synthase
MKMSNPESFGETRTASVTVLVDNHADLILGSTESVKRFVGEPLLAEHGFAALVDLNEGEIRILLDTGFSRIALLENMKRMKIDHASIHKIVLSHGHADHTASVSELLRAMDLRPKPRQWEAGVHTEEMSHWSEYRRVPLIVHPAAFRERWIVRKDGSKFGPFLPPPLLEWEALGAEVIMSEGPYQFGQGCFSTGFVPRLSFEQPGTSGVSYREGDLFKPDDVEEDQAIAINVKEKGLVVLSGCAHAGIVNTVNYAKKLSGVNRVYAVIGGFHLSEVKDEEIELTIAEMKACGTGMVVPSHCTGLRATCKFARRMPGEFVTGVVGTTYLF